MVNALLYEISNLSASLLSGGLVLRSRLWDQRVPGLKPDSTEGLLHVKSYVEVKHPLVGVVQKFGEGYQLWCHPRHLTEVKITRLLLSHNSPCVALKCDVNITKVNSLGVNQ
ncbi:hypothetical protein AVEN_114057-1 [Araneus ventricosus]|uniref:Uncharacterized protein n=1 Tax=Araneus ventricosus TaxID=182803 RepID=A0A4Y2Q4E1_ARAVE|nr:hypothetical protein AVEN_114057-1 [Araneus ventricosus]